MLKSSDDERNGELPEAISAEKEAVYDFSDSEDEEEMEKRLRKIEVNIRRKQKKVIDVYLWYAMFTCCAAISEINSN